MFRVSFVVTEICFTRRVRLLILVFCRFTLSWAQSHKQHGPVFTDFAASDIFILKRGHLLLTSSLTFWFPTKVVFIPYCYIWRPIFIDESINFYELRQFSDSRRSFLCFQFVLFETELLFYILPRVVFYAFQVSLEKFYWAFVQTWRTNYFACSSSEDFNCFSNSTEEIFQWLEPMFVQWCNRFSVRGDKRNQKTTKSIRRCVLIPVN